MFAAIIGGVVWLLAQVPGSFVPPEDQGYIIAAAQLPDGATLERTGKTTEQLRLMLKDNQAIKNIFIVNGFDLIGGGSKSSAATIFVPLKPWEQRQQTAMDLAGQVSGMGFTALGDGIAFAFNPPPIQGLGQAGGFEVYVQDRADPDPQRLAQVTQDFMAALAARAELTPAQTFFRPTVPQLRVDVDREKAIALGVPINEVFDALQAQMGSLYVNDFNKSGRTYRVTMQADAAYRAKPEDLGRLYVRSSTSGQMVPLKALINVSEIIGPEQIERYNSYIAAKVLGNAKPGFSSGEAMRAVEEVARATLPAGYAIEWTGQAFQEKRTGNASIFAFGFALIMVYLILAALYERWGVPLAVVLAVPFALLGALGFVALRGMENDIYFQIGLIVLIGLAAKNAILIAEFAMQGMEAGLSAIDAAAEAARLRFRPIVMTSLAFVLGVRAAGAGHRRRRGGAPEHGQRRVRRHDRRHLRGADLHSAVLQPAGPQAATEPQPRAARGASMKRLARLIGLLSATALLAACAAAPESNVPEPGLPAAYPGSATASGGASLAGNWWTLFNDPALNRLVDAALVRNADLRLAVARVDAASAVLGVVRSAGWPSAWTWKPRRRARASARSMASRHPAAGPSRRRTGWRCRAASRSTSGAGCATPARRRRPQLLAAQHAPRHRAADAGRQHGAALLRAARARRADGGARRAAARAPGRPADRRAAPGRRRGIDARAGPGARGAWRQRRRRSPSCGASARCWRISSASSRVRPGCRSMLPARPCPRRSACRPGLPCGAAGAAARRAAGRGQPARGAGPGGGGACGDVPDPVADRQLRRPECRPGRPAQERRAHLVDRPVAAAAAVRRRPQRGAHRAGAGRRPSRPRSRYQQGGADRVPRSGRRLGRRRAGRAPGDARSHCSRPPATTRCASPGAATTSATRATWRCSTPSAARRTPSWRGCARGSLRLDASVALMKALGGGWSAPR